MIKTRTWILLLGGLLLAGLLFLLRPLAEARFAEIWSDGELVCKGRNCAVFFDFWKEEW